MDASLRGKRVAVQRQTLLSGVQGKVLEIGFGTGLNLAAYPAHIKTVTAIDLHPDMPGQVSEHLQRDLAVDIRSMSAERLDFADETFDSVVSTFTLRSIPDLDAALRGIHRVLKPGGGFFFLEHGLSRHRIVAGIQELTDPLYVILACGCHVNRDMSAHISASGLRIEWCEAFYPLARISGYTLKGVARKTA